MRLFQNSCHPAIDAGFSAKILELQVFRFARNDGNFFN